MCSDRISCVEKLPISAKFILIKFGNGYVHQTSHVFSFNGVLYDIKQTTYFADDWWQDKISMLSTILAIIIHDNSCRYGNKQTTYFADDWWQDKISMLSTILAIIIHDNSCRYGNMTHYQ